MIILAKNLEISNLLDIYGGMLNEHQRDFVDLYYNEDLSLAEISEHKGITRQGVRDNIKRGENYLLDLEEKVGVFKRQRQFNKQIEQISEKLGQISMISMTEEDKNLLNEIKTLCEKLTD